MSKDMDTFWVICFWAVVVGIFSFISFCRGMDAGTKRMQDECYKRGVAIHHPVTGEFSWETDIRVFQVYSTATKTAVEKPVCTNFPHKFLDNL